MMTRKKIYAQTQFSFPQYFQCVLDRVHRCRTFKIAKAGCMWISQSSGVRDNSSHRQRRLTVCGLARALESENVFLGVRTGNGMGRSQAETSIQAGWNSSLAMMAQQRSRVTLCALGFPWLPPLLEHQAVHGHCRHSVMDS